MTPQEQAQLLKDFQKTLRSQTANAHNPGWFEVIDRCVDVMLSIHIEQLDTETKHMSDTSKIEETPVPAAVAPVPAVKPRIDLNAPDDVDVYVNGRLVPTPFSFGHKP